MEVLFQPLLAVVIHAAVKHEQPASPKAILSDAAVFIYTLDASSLTCTLEKTAIIESKHEPSCDFSNLKEGFLCML